MDLDLIRRLSQPHTSKVVLCVLDGLGGLPGPRGRTELEEADTKNLDRLAEAGSLGRTMPVGPGIAPGSGPGHMALFGYDPLVFDIGRGALEGTGIGFQLGPNDIAARGNLCTLGPDGLIVDRRAGRLATERTAEICARLREIKLPGVETFVEPVQDQRFLLVLRGTGLSDQLVETDPQHEGMAPIIATATGPGGDHIASLVQQWVKAAEAMLKDDLPANGVLLRGWSGRPVIPPFPELWKLRAAAITAYPMYRGVAELCGMTPILGAHSFEEEVALLKQHWDEYDFFFVHYKYADSAGEDGDFRRKQEAISAFDVWVPEIVDLKPDVLVVTGDHSTPATMASHSWHHVPLLLWGNNVRPDDKHQFSETLCRGGELGDLLAKEVMPVAMAHAGRLARYGA